MACARGVCTADKIFIFINIGFAMYSGALLATAARLAWDPSTYTWFRFLCAAQYRASAAYVLAAGLWLAALVYLAAAAAAPQPHPRPKQAPRCLHLYAAGVVCLGVSEVGYGAWMAASLAAWWREAPEAELARRGLDLLHDLRPALLAVERYRDLARPVLDMLDEVEREAPNNVYVIVVFALVGAVLQVAAFVLARGARGGVGRGAGAVPRDAAPARAALRAARAAAHGRRAAHPPHRALAAAACAPPTRIASRYECPFDVALDRIVSSSAFGRRACGMERAAGDLGDASNTFIIINHKGEIM